MKNQITATIWIEKIDPEPDNVLGEFEVDLVGEYHREDRGSRGDYGVPMEPTTPAYVEFISAKVDGEEIELDKYDQERAEMALWEAVCED